MSPATSRATPGGGHGKLVAIADDIHAALHGRSMSLAALYDWLERRHSPDQLRAALARLQSEQRVVAEKNRANLPIYSRPDAPPQAAGIKHAPPPGAPETSAPADINLSVGTTTSHKFVYDVKIIDAPPAPATLGPNPYPPGTQPHRIWEWLSQHGPHTYLQIASATGIPDTRVSPTLAMMKAHATVARDKQVGNPSSTWRALAHGPVSAGNKKTRARPAAPPAASAAVPEPTLTDRPATDATQQQAELAQFAARLRHASGASGITIDLPIALHTLDVLAQHAPLSVAYTLGQIRQCLSILHAAPDPTT